MPARGLAMQNVNKYFGDVHAVRDLSLEIEEGEFLVLVGPSGCGKTTALRMIAGLEEPSSGSIFIGEREVTDVQPRDRDIAMVFQSYALYPHMTVFDNLAFGLKQRKTPQQERETRVAEVAKMLDIEHLLKRRPKELSGGQRQRVALGRAIVRRPKAFLMDEPLSNLDAQLRLHTRAEIARLHRQLGTTVVYVTHDQVEAMTLGTRIAVLKDGLLQQLDTPKRLYDAPANTFVATFIGSPAMNLLHGWLTRTAEGIVFHSADASFLIEAEVVQRATTDEVTLGLRPEHFERHPGAARQGGIAGEVILLELLGSDLFATIRHGGGQVTARLDPGADVSFGETITVVPQAQHALLFDRATGVLL